MTESKQAKRSLIASMLIFGTIGIFRKYIPLSSELLAMLRGFIGTGFLLLLVKLRGMSLSMEAIRKNFILLVISGALIGLNWIALFEAYQYTSVAVATLCYYMAPVIVILCSPLLLGEKLTGKKLLCVGCAFLGMVFVSGVLAEGLPSLQEGKGILLGLLAASLYACAVIMNKKMHPIAAYDRTIIQLGAAAIVLLPYNLLVPSEPAAITAGLILLVAVVGIIHTGLAYAMYFGSMDKLKVQTVAIYSYIDPVTAIILSLLVFREDMGLHGVIGAVLILGSTLASDLLDR